MVGRQLDRARLHAKAGETTLMASVLAMACRYAKRVGIDLAGVAEIETAGYGKGLEVNVEHARAAARQGELGAMESALQAAQRCAQKLGVDVPDLGEVAKPCYARAVEERLALARREAAAGARTAMEVALSMARSYAAKAGIDVRDRVKDIRSQVKPAPKQKGRAKAPGTK